MNGFLLSSKSIDDKQSFEKGGQQSVKIQHKKVTESGSNVNFETIMPPEIAQQIGCWPGGLNERVVDELGLKVYVQQFPVYP